MTDEGPNDAAAKVAYLVEHLPAPVEVVETHMSWVFLTPDRVFKLKKPVRHPFLDHRTLAARQADCEAEVELNEALAPGVYLGTTRVAMDANGYTLNGAGHVVDWLVVMRRLPASEMLDHRLTDGGVSDAELDALVAHLHAFFVRTPSEPMEPTDYRGALAATLELDGGELLYHGDLLDQAAVADLVGELDVAIRDYPHLGARARATVDGHGDLRPEHVVVSPEPLVIDRITFDRSLRRSDPLHDLALLAVECSFLEAPQVGRGIMDRWVRTTGAPVPPPLGELYQALRAATRARLSIAHLRDDEVDVSAWTQRTQRYLDIAAGHLAGFREGVRSPCG